VAAVHLLGEAPDQQLAADLPRFKEIIEQRRDESVQNHDRCRQTNI
jgi:uncharacterized membrane protein